MNEHHNLMLPLAQRLSDDELALIRRIGQRLRNVITNEPFELEQIFRADELGILSSMVDRTARELALERQRTLERQAALEHAREEAEQRGSELEQGLAELSASYAAQAQLMSVIRELSTPVLQIYADVLLVPLIGTISRERINDLQQILLGRLGATQARVIIIDITGIAIIDIEVANGLVQTARAAQLLGALVLICGFSPAVAEVMVSLHVDLTMLETFADLHAAMVRALALVGVRIVRQPSDVTS